MREIKFRAWDAKEKQMLEVNHLLNLDNGQPIEVWTNDYEGGYRFNPDKSEIMQFTGIYDKNGREIYEGDIVHAYDQEPDRYYPDYRGSEATGIVEFHGSMFTLDYYIVLAYPPILEVIGNIFENTEMLEAEK